MKKILSFVTVFFLIVALSVPALAYDTPTVGGVWVFNDVLTFTFDDSWLVQSVNFTFPNSDAPDTTRTRFQIGKANEIVIADGGGASFTIYKTADGWIHPDKQILDFGTSQVVSDDFYTWLIANATSYMCDGSSCPATDLNADGICDDCGAPLSLRLTGYPALPAVNGNNLESVVLQRDDGYFYMALTSDIPYSVSGSVGDNYLITVADETEVTYVTFKCTDGQNWVHNSTGSAYSLSVGSSSATLLASTFDWYKDGSLFFQVPLWTEMELVTQGEMQGLTTETFGTMNILLLCGVGLMALLVVLKLFGKRSLIFRS